MIAFNSHKKIGEIYHHRRLLHSYFVHSVNNVNLVLISVFYCFRKMFYDNYFVRE